MKYIEMVKFLNDNGIQAMQPVIASEVSSQLETDIPDEEFEEICDNVLYAYLSAYEEPSIWDLVDIELRRWEYKE